MDPKQLVQLWELYHEAIEEARAALRNDTITVLTTPVERVESVIEVDGDDDEGGDDSVVESRVEG